MSEEAPRPSDAPGPAVLALYGGPALAAGGAFLYVQFYFLSFATDVLLLAPAAVGGLLALGRVWDAITDPITGSLSDRTRGRRGRRRPWMLWAAPIAALSFAALWSPPQAGAGATLAWCAVALFAFTAAITAWNIPHQALGAELAAGPRARSQIFGARTVASLLGAAVAFGAMQAVVNAVEPRRVAAELAVAAAAVMAAALLVPPLALREPRRGAEAPDAPLAGWRAVARSAPARRVLFVWFATQIAGAAQGVIAPYMSIYVLKRGDLIGLFPAFYIGPLAAAVPLWIHFARRWGARRVWRGSLLGCAFAYLSLLALTPDGVLVAALLLANAGFWSAASGPLGPTLLAAAVDEDAERDGVRRDGVFFAAKEFVEKAGAASVAVVVGVALQLSGFEPNTDQGPAALLAIRLCLAALPAAALFAAAAVLGPRPASAGGAATGHGAGW